MRRARQPSPRRLEQNRDPHGMAEDEEKVLRRFHADHPYCDTCEVLAQLDIERAGHKLEVMALQAQVKNLQERLDHARRGLVHEVLQSVKFRGEGIDEKKPKS